MRLSITKKSSQGAKEISMSIKESNEKKKFPPHPLQKEKKGKKRLLNATKT